MLGLRDITRSCMPALEGMLTSGEVSSLGQTSRTVRADSVAHCVLAKIESKCDRAHYKMLLKDAKVKDGDSSQTKIHKLFVTAQKLSGCEAIAISLEGADDFLAAQTLESRFTFEDKALLGIEDATPETFLPRLKSALGEYYSYEFLLALSKIKNPESFHEALELAKRKTYTPNGLMLLTKQLFSDDRLYARFSEKQLNISHSTCSIEGVIQALQNDDLYAHFEHMIHMISIFEQSGVHYHVFDYSKMIGHAQKYGEEGIEALRGVSAENVDTLLGEDRWRRKLSKVKPFIACAVGIGLLALSSTIGDWIHGTAPIAIENCMAYGIPGYPDGIPVQDCAL